MAALTAPTARQQPQRDFFPRQSIANVAPTDVAIRCTMPACPCECFLPGKTQTRQCETCKHGWVPHALDKLGLRPVQHCWSSGGAVSASGPVEPVLPNTVFDVASLALYGCQAVPIRLKILLDRLFSVLNTEDIIQVLTAFGWTLEDYAKGYMLQDMQGRALETWTVCTKEEEPLVLQQFLRFGETRAIAARILQQHQQQLQQLQQQENEVRERDSRDRDKVRKHSGEESKESSHRTPKINTDIKKFLDKTKPSGASTTAPPSSSSANSSSAGSFSSSVTSMPPPGSFTCPPGLASLPFPLLPGLSALSGPLARFPGLLPIPPSVASLSQHMRLPSSGLASLPLSPPIQPSIPLSVAQSPLGRLQGMQPFDFRKSEPRDSRSPPESMRRQHSSAPSVNTCTSVTYTSSTLTAPVASPLCLTKSQSAPANQNPMTGSRSRSPSASSSSELDWDDDMDQDDMDDVYDAQNALNLTRDKSADAGDAKSAKRYMDGPLTGRGLPDISDSLNEDKRLHNLQRRDVKPPGGSPVKRSWNPLGPLGTQLINPATGKKRVQCNVCLKTFCDKGALKIHFSAVHLREMHKCTVEGCNMMFSSRRSRNRHSANPNPKLHSPHLRRKISPHDGRTSQPHPILLSQGLGLPPAMGPFGTGMHPHHPSLGSLPLGLGSLHPDVGAAGLSLNASAGASGASSGAPERSAGGASNNHSVSSLSSGRGDTPTDRNGVPSAANQRPPYFASSDDDDDDVDDDVDDLDDMDDDRLSAMSADDDERRQRSVPPPKIPPSASGASSGRKRKSQNPTRLLQVDERNVSSDEEDESKRRRRTDQPEDVPGSRTPPTESAPPKNGLPSAESSIHLPQQHEAARTQSGAENGVNGHADGTKTAGPLDDNILRHLEHLAGNGLRLNLNDKRKNDQVASDEDLDDEDLDDEEDDDSPLSDSSSLAASFMADVPIDKENPRRCAACGKIFQNHFGVKTHYQNVHLKLMHKCTVDGCQAAFPSKRSRDRHAANLNLHRKLLSTSSAAGQSNSAPASPTEADAEPKNDFFGGLSALNGALRDQLLSRIYANAEASMMGLSPFLPPPPSLFMPALGHGPLTPAASAFLRHHNNNNGKSSMDTASPPPSSPSDRPDEESAGATPPPAALYPCTVDNCTKIFVSPHLRNAHCQDDHDNSAAVRNSI